MWLFMFGMVMFAAGATLLYREFWQPSGWVKVVRDHPCRLPRLRRHYTYGSRWKCECGQIWEVVSVYQDDLINERKPNWVKWEEVKL